MSIPGARTRTTCPRCGAAVTGEYRFCPECAFRLHAGDLSSAREIDREVRWGNVVAIVCLAIVFGGFLAAGFWVLGPRPDAPSSTVPTAADTRLRVEDIRRDLVAVRGGESYVWEEPASGPGFVVVGPFWMMKYEVTRGQYEEFVRAVREDPSRLDELGDWLDELFAPEGDPSYAQAYLDAWWSRVTERVRRRGREAPERPAWLRPPVALEHRHLVLTPPSWVTVDADGALDWALPKGTANLPATEVSFHDAQAFAAWIAKVALKIPLRLPSQAEFIRAFHGGNPWIDEEQPGWKWPWGNEADPYGCNSADFYPPGREPGPRDVRAAYGHLFRRTSAEGIHGLAGNAREWVLNETPVARTGEQGQVYYVGQLIDDSEFAPTLGGSYLRTLEECTVQPSHRLTQRKRVREPDLGFRLAQTDFR